METFQHVWRPLLPSDSRALIAYDDTPELVAVEVAAWPNCAAELHIDNIARGEKVVYRPHAGERIDLRRGEYKLSVFVDEDEKGLLSEAECLLFLHQIGGLLNIGTQTERFVIEDRTAILPQQIYRSHRQRVIRNILIEPSSIWETAAVPIPATGAVGIRAVISTTIAGNTVIFQVFGADQVGLTPLSVLLLEVTVVMGLATDVTVFEGPVRRTPDVIEGEYVMLRVTNEEGFGVITVNAEIQSSHN